MYLLAHLSDPHLGPIPEARISELLGKRFFGMMNWIGARRRNFGAATLAPLLTDLLAQGADHIAVTGDLVNVSLPSEFDTGATFLTSLGAPDAVTVVPGNHDAYVHSALAYHLEHWRAFPLGRRHPSGYAARPGLLPLRAPARAGCHRGREHGHSDRHLPRQRRGRPGATGAPVPDAGGTEAGRPVPRGDDPSPPGRRTALPPRPAGRQGLPEGDRRGGSGAGAAWPRPSRITWLDRHARPAGAGGGRPLRLRPAPRMAARAGRYNLYRISGEPGAWRCEMEARGYMAGQTDVSSRERRVIIGE